MKCRDKYRHPSYQAAQNEADSYHESVALTFDPMTAYFCARHNCWHVGHDRFFPPDQRRIYAIRSADRYRHQGTVHVDDGCMTAPR